ncbi:MAG: hypothetical protein M1830_008097 [Pleopsidium flavum]|nr:MAG: hypothetical protein M1830_008097 [Pleopsidium flavum]
MGYGFSVRSNPRDSYLLRIGIHQDGPLDMVRRRQREIHGKSYPLMEAEERDVYTLYSPFRSYCKGYEHRIPEFRAFPPAMLDDVSILVANQRELDTIGFSDERFWLFGNGTFSRNDFSVMSHLLRILRLRRNRITCHDSELPPWPQNERQFYAARYRRGQLQILNDIIKSLEQGLNNALSATLDGLPGKLLDLRQIIYRFPDPLCSLFQAGLDAAFGTHKPSLLKKKGWEDAVFTLWICVLWIMQKVHGEVIPDRQGLDKRLVIWIDFLSEHYGDEKLPIEYVAAMLNEDSPDHENNDVDEENQKRLIRYSEEITQIIQHAARQDPKCIFNHRSWSGDLVRWGFRVLNAESVNVPPRDEDSDSGDRLALFLENRKSLSEPDVESSPSNDERPKP